MSFTKSIFSSELLSTFGWTIIHSVWIGGIVFLLAWMLLYLFRNGKANHRYLIAVGSLFAFLILVTVAFFKVNALQNTDYGLNLSIGENFKNLSYNLIEASNLTYLTNNFSLASIENYINQNIPILVVIWLVGLLFFSLRFFGGLAYTYRMRSRSQKIADGELNNVLKQISQKIGLKSTVQIKETSLISSPMVIGFVKPIILLPLGMANGLSLHQVEAILFHEIAHIYRFDYLVNLIQSMVEVVLFYHPVVWWLSAHIRAERENICDDIAIEHTGSAIDYAKALTNLQDLNKQTPDIVLAFSNKKYRFMNRIRRLLGLPLIENNLIEGLISSLLLVVSIILFTTHAGPVFAQTNDMEILEEESLSNIELPILNDQDQESKQETNSKKIAKQLEEKLVEDQKTIAINDKKLSNTQKELRIKLQNMEQKRLVSGNYDRVEAQELTEKSLTQVKSIIKKLENHKLIQANLSIKLKKLTPKLDNAITKRLNNHLLNNEKLLLNTLKKANLITQAFLAKSTHFPELSQDLKIKEKQKLIDKKQQIQKQKEIAYKQNLSKAEQKKIQLELQKMQDYQKKVAQFSKKAEQELKMKSNFLKKAQKELEESEPTNEMKAKLKAMKTELKEQEMKFVKIKKDQERKLIELKDKMKDKMADIREIDKLEEAEMERKIEKVMEVEKIEEEMMEKEIEQVIEVKMKKERSVSDNYDGERAQELTKQKPEFSVNSAIFYPDKNTVELIGNVCFKTEILEFKNAKKVLWNRETNEIIVSGLAEFTIDGKIQFSKKREKKILRYKIGERIAYVE